MIVYLGRENPFNTISRFSINDLKFVMPTSVHWTDVG